MSHTTKNPGYIVRHVSDVVPTPCPCGSSVRIITREDTPEAGFHITHITDSQRHYHKKTTEIYHIIEGHGVLELGEDHVDLRPGLTILIEKETPHRGFGNFKTIVIMIPAFDNTDEYIVGE